MLMLNKDINCYINSNLWTWILRLIMWYHKNIFRFLVCNSRIFILSILGHLSQYFVNFALLIKFHLSSSSSFENGHIVITAYHHLWWLPVLFILISIHNLTPLPSGSYESILTWNPFLHLHLCIKSQSSLRFFSHDL